MISGRLGLRLLGVIHWWLRLRLRRRTSRCGWLWDRDCCWRSGYRRAIRWLGLAGVIVTTTFKALDISMDELSAFENN